MNPTTMVRLWSLQNVFLLWLISPKIVELSAERCIVRVPLNWRTRRKDIRAMYLGTLCMGADVAAGLIAFQLVAEKRVKINFIFKDMKAEFIKRAEGAVVFTNNDGPVVQDLVRRALESGQREEATVRVTATVPEKLGDEAVARFELTLSVKRKG
jgi:hypothetical protein